jgi:hypothetical protein
MVPAGAVKHTLVLSVHVRGDVTGKLECDKGKAHIQDVVDMVRELLQASGWVPQAPIPVYISGLCPYIWNP